MIENFGQVTLIENATESELAKIAAERNLDPTIFEKINSATNVARFLKIESITLAAAHLLVTFDLHDTHDQIETELTPTIAIFDHNQLLLCSYGNFIDLKKEQLIQAHPLSIIIKNLLISAKHIDRKLRHIKNQIDYLDQAARKTTKTKELKSVTDLTRKLVYLEHTLDDQFSTIEEFCNYLTENKLTTKTQINDLMVKERRLTKTIHIYRDLLDSINSLFTAMMDSHLNHLMKFLDSAALVISIPALISGIWGMNVGGLPGKEDDNGFWLVILAGTVLAVICGILLKQKKYND